MSTDSTPAPRVIPRAGRDIVLPPEAAQIPDDAPLFRELICEEINQYDPIELLYHLRVGLDGLDEVAATTTTDRLLPFDPPRGSNIHKLLPFLPMWRLPTEYAGGYKRDSPRGRPNAKFVNPKCPHAHLYSDAFVVCECGAVVTHVDHSNGPDHIDVSAVTDNLEHTDECCNIWRWRARHALWERRRDIMVEAFSHFVPSTELVARLGYTGESLRQYPSDHDVDVVALRDVARERLAWSAVANLHRHSPEVIGIAFGLSRDGVHSIIEHCGIRGQVDLHALAWHRRRNGVALEVEV